MDISKLMELLNISDSNSIWIKNKSNKYIANNPYRLENNTLYNSKDELCDDILARLIRGEFYVYSPCFTYIKKYEKYYFLNEKMEIKSRKNKENLTDLMNIFIGNIFKSKEEITEEEKIRLESVVKMFEKKRILFTLKVNGDETFNQLKDVIDGQYSKHDICEESEHRGILKRASLL